MAQCYHNKNLTATVTSATVVLNGEFTIDFIEINNDSATVDLHIELTNLKSTTSDFIVIKPKETRTFSNSLFTNLVYKTLTGSASFRVMALNNNG